MKMTIECQRWITYFCIDQMFEDIKSTSYSNLVIIS